MQPAVETPELHALLGDTSARIGDHQVTDPANASLLADAGVQLGRASQLATRAVGQLSRHGVSKNSTLFVNRLTGLAVLYNAATHPAIFWPSSKGCKARSPWRF